MTLRPALFLDRDGTIMVDVHYPRDPSAVRLIEGAAAAIRQANDAQVPVIVVTNQSGIGRGLISIAEYEAVHARLVSLLASHGAHVDAVYHCPHWPERDGECECRKPAPGMYIRAASENGIDLRSSSFIGDRWRDIAAGVRFGGTAFMVPKPGTPPDEVDRARAEAMVVPTLSEAVNFALTAMSTGKGVQAKRANS